MNVLYVNRIDANDIRGEVVISLRRAIAPVEEQIHRIAEVVGEARNALPHEAGIAAMHIPSRTVGFHVGVDVAETDATAERNAKITPDRQVVSEVEHARRHCEPAGHRTGYAAGPVEGVLIVAALEF